MESVSCLLLGGNGYVGSALALYLGALGISVSSVDNRPASIVEAGGQPCRNFRDLTREELADFDNIVLLAGNSSVSSCDRHPQEAFANNVTSFVELVHKLKGQRLIFASSSSIYVRTGGRPACETEALPDPVSYYDLHKQMIEQYARIAYPNSYALRLGTVCGPSPNMRTDVLLNSFVWCALTRGQIEVGNRNRHRPILGIHDLCRAVTALFTQPVSPGPYNLASANVRIGDVADYVAERFQVPCLEVERPTSYDMAVSSDRFIRATGLVFRDTVASLVDELAATFAVQHSLCPP